MTNFSNVEADVWQAVQDLNRAWTVEKNPDRLRNYFHETMTAITPSDRERRQGREACVTGWMQFAENVRIREWEELEPRIHLYCDNQAAVVTYFYRIVFENSGRTTETRGRDMFFMVKENGCWQAVADQFSGFPASQEQQ